MNLPSRKFTAMSGTFLFVTPSKLVTSALLHSEVGQCHNLSQPHANARTGVIIGVKRADNLRPSIGLRVAGAAYSITEDLLVVSGTFGIEVAYLLSTARALSATVSAIAACPSAVG
jgi:hypothetical protein